MERQYSLPENFRVYAIGDVHGYLEPLEEMQDKIAMDLGRDEYQGRVHIVYLGDYVDRGPDSKGVIDYLIGRRERGDDIDKTFLLGNHEWSMMYFARLIDGDARGDEAHWHANAESWIKHGGIQTMLSYGVEVPDVILPAEYETLSRQFHSAIQAGGQAEFLRSLRSSFSLGDYFFAHAGVNPEVPLAKQLQRDLCSIRQPFLSWHKDPLYKPLVKKVVHGHSISKDAIVRPHRIGVDTGLYEGGALTAAVLEGAEVRFLQVYPR